MGWLSFTNNNSFVLAGNNALTLNNNGGGVRVNVSGGTANNIKVPVNLADNASFILATNQALTISGVISNASSTETIAVEGGGTLALSGNNTYGPASGSVGTTLSAGGLLQVGSPAALSAGDVSIVAGGTLQAGTSLSLANNISIAPGAVGVVDSHSSTLTLNGLISGSGSLTKIGSGTVVLNGGSTGSNTFGGGLTIDAGQVSITQDGQLGPLTLPLSFIGGDLAAGASSVTLNPGRNIAVGALQSLASTNFYLDAPGSSSLTVPGAIGNNAGNSGLNNLFVNAFAGSAGSVNLEGPGTFTGATSISNGILRLLGNANGTPTNSNQSLAGSTVTVNAGAGALVFDSSMVTATFGGLSGTGNVYLTNSAGSIVTLTIGNNNQNASFAGDLIDGGVGGILVKNGTGTQTLTGTNTYIGTTTVNGGTLAVSTGGVLNSGALAGNGFLVNGGLLTNASSITSSMNNAGNAIVETAGTVNVGEITTTADADGFGMAIYGGTFICPNIDLSRNNQYAAPTATAPVPALTTVGLYIDSTNTLQPANVTLGSLEIADAHGANSSSSARMDAGTLTVTGEIMIGHQGSTGRWSVFQINGGIFTNTDSANGIVIANSGSAANDAEMLFSGGTSFVQTINFGTSSDSAGGIGDLIITNATVYVGSSGINQPAGSSYVPTFWMESGILGASANWQSTVSANGSGTGFQLPIATTNFTIQTADAANNPWNISLYGGIGGVGGITKTGGGTLTLGGTNTYTGSTIVSNGTLMLNPNGGTVQLTASSVTVEPGAIFDVSQAPAFVVGSSASQGLLGFGTNNGNVTIGASGQSLCRLDQHRRH